MAAKARAQHAGGRDQPAQAQQMDEREILAQTLDGDAAEDKAGQNHALQRDIRGVGRAHLLQHEEGRKTDPGRQGHGGQPGREHAEHEAPVAENGDIAAHDGAAIQARLGRRRARHALEQAQQGQQRQQAGEEKHVAPVEPADDGAAEDGAGQGREDGGARQNAAELDGRHVVEQFMDHGIADEDEAAAHALDETQGEKLLDGSGKRHGQGGQQE